MSGSDCASRGEWFGSGRRGRQDECRDRSARLRRFGVAAVVAAVVGSGLAAPSAVAGVHKGNYTCYQAGYLYWGQFEVKKKNRYKISGGKGKFKIRNGNKLVFKKGPLKKWGWKGKYSTGRSPGGVKEWQVDLIDRKNGIKINCYD